MKIRLYHIEMKRPEIIQKRTSSAYVVELHDWLKSVATKVDQAAECHKRLGHASAERFIKLLDMFDGIPKSILFQNHM